MATEEENYISILIGGRRFVRVENGAEIPVDVRELKEGDRFALYSGDGSGNEVKCHWGAVDEFICNGKTFKNADDVEFIPCMLTW